MRKDMAKVIVERPRIKPWSTRKGRRADPEDLPTHEGLRRGHAERGDRKQLNENLAPLRRYLAKQVGRPWDKVYAEICENLRVDNIVQRHVRSHLHDFVAIKPRRIFAGWSSSFRGGLWWQPFYVDPTTGLLCRTDRLPEEKARRRAKRNRKAAPVDHVRLADERELRLIEGLWFEVRLAPLPEPVYRTSREHVRTPCHLRRRNEAPVEMEMDIRRLVSPPVWDVVAKKMIAVGPVVDTPENWGAYRRQQAERRYAAAKRTVSRRELRQHGLQNEADDAGQQA